MYKSLSRTIREVVYGDQQESQVVESSPAEIVDDRPVNFVELSIPQRRALVAFYHDEEPEAKDEIEEIEYLYSAGLLSYDGFNKKFRITPLALHSLKINTYDNVENLEKVSVYTKSNQTS